MKIVIVDDDKKALKRLNNVLIDNYGEVIEAIAEFNDPMTFIKSEVEFDVLFLDIEMPGINGIELSERESLSTANIVFVTGRDSLVFQAYNATNAIGFVRKNNLLDDLKVIMNKLLSVENSTGSIVVKKDKDVVKLPYKSVVYIENHSNDIIIHTAHGDYNKRYKISDAELELADYGFIRCHAGYIVNLIYIDYIGERDITLTTGESIPVSRKRTKSVKEKFLKLNGV